MGSIDGDKIKLLGKLIHNTSEDSDVQSALTSCPMWGKYEQAGVLPPGASDILTSLHQIPLKDRGPKVAEDPNVAKALLAALQIEVDTHAVQYALAVIHGMIRNDSSCYDALLTPWKKLDVFTPFHKLIDRAIDRSTTDVALFLCTGFVSRAKTGMFSDDQITFLIHGIVSGTYKASTLGRLEALGNILKLNTLREVCWNYSGFTELLKKALSKHSNIPQLYASCFCVWLLTFGRKYISNLFEADFIKLICVVMRECKTEKVIRLCTRILVNSMAYDQALELIIDHDVLQTLTLLGYEKWRDCDTFEEIQEGLSSLQSKVRLLSNFDRYKHELETGQLKWSILHSEKFWHANVKHFEENEFAAIRRLFDIIKSPKSTNLTLAVACHDVGEFARLHPVAKKMLTKMQVKTVVMALMQHNDREVCREALLCTQKLMLERWQAVAAVDAF